MSKTHAEQFQQLQSEVENRRRNQQPVADLLQQQLDILQRIYQEFKIRTEQSGTDYTRNFDKYWTELEYLASLRRLLVELDQPIAAIEQQEQVVKDYMTENFGYAFD